MSTMQILFLNYEYPPLGGGAGVITQNICEGLASRGHKITVLTTWFEGEKEDTTNNNLRIIRVRSRRKKIYESNPREMVSWIIHSKKYLKQHLKNNKYDLCFANFALPCGEVAYSMKLHFKLPYVIMSHGHDIPWFMPEQMMWYHAATYHWIRKICLQSQRNYVQSQDMKYNIDAFLGKFSYKNKIIYNGWNSTLFKPDYSKRTKDFTLLLPGRLVKQKDPITVLKAINILSKEIPEIKLKILGNGKLKSKMIKYVQNNNLNNNVIFRDWLTKEQMLEEYQSASATILPSLNEGMSIATLEALACGQYIFTTKVSNNEKLINKGVNGEFINKKDYMDIVLKIKDYYKNKFTQSYLINIDYLTQYKQLFEWDSIIEQYEKDLLQILDK